MSRTGKKPVAPVSGVTVTINGQTVTAKGPKGEMSVGELWIQLYGALKDRDRL